MIHGFKIEVKSKKNENSYLIRLSAIHSTAPIYFSELLVPVVEEERDGKRYFHMDFNNSTGPTGRDYRGQYALRTKQKDILDSLEEAAQEALLKIVEKGKPFSRGKKVKVEHDSGFEISPARVSPMFERKTLEKQVRVYSGSSFEELYPFSR